MKGLAAQCARAARRFVRRPFASLATVPAAIAIGIACLAPLVVMADRLYFAPLGLEFAFGPDEARTILTIVATAAMTALSLAYSLTLVVFTLAASAIGPRLLRRFTADRFNQATAGVFAGTFLYALSVLAWAAPDGASSLAVIGALFLAAVSVVQLIAFVRHVASSVSVDDEVAAISERLTDALKAEAARFTELDETPDDDAFAHVLAAEEHGYVGAIDYDALVECGSELGCVIRVERQPGVFVMRGDPLLKLTMEPGDDQAKALLAAVAIEPARSETSPVEFSIHLLAEIAMRALSPGVSDPYTAVAAADAITASLAEVAGADRGAVGFVDEGGAARVVAAGLSFEALADQAYHPLRRASATDILACAALARCLLRLHETASDSGKAVVRRHIGLLDQELDRCGALDDDVAYVRSLFPAEK